MTRRAKGPPKFRRGTDEHEAWDRYFAAALTTRMAGYVLRTEVPAGDRFFREVERARAITIHVAIAAVMADEALLARRLRYHASATPRGSR